MYNRENNMIINLTFDFALMVIDYTELLEEKRKFVIARQLMKSGTSIGANANEAQNAESTDDFIHKMKIAAKEADETTYWLKLCKHAKSYPSPDVMMDKIDHIQRVLTKIISTSKANNPKYRYKK